MLFPRDPGTLIVERVLTGVALIVSDSREAFIAIWQEIRVQQNHLFAASWWQLPRAPRAEPLFGVRPHPAKRPLHRGLQPRCRLGGRYGARAIASHRAYTPPT